jgi:hypothetical protein
MRQINLLWGLLPTILALFAFSGLTTTTNAQEVMLKPDTLHVSLDGPEFETGSPYLTADVKAKLHTLFEIIEEKWGDTKQLEYFILGQTNPQNWPEGCKSDRRWGINDNWPAAITDKATLAQCGRQNELILEAARGFGVKSFLVKENLVDPYKAKTGIYGAVDSVDGKPTRKTVDIVVIKHRYTALPTIPDLDDYVRKDNQAKRDNAQDKIMAENRDGIITNREEIKKLWKAVNEKDDQGVDFSAHLGINAERFADQLAPTISAGLQIGHLEFSGWYGLMPDAGTGMLNDTEVDIRRETYGGMATYYFSISDRLQLGPSIGWEHGEDAIDGRAEYLKVYESALAGASLDVQIAGPLHLRANLSWAPVIKSYTYDNTTFKDDAAPIRFSAGLSLTF